MKQVTLFDLEAFTKLERTADPFWDEIEIAPEQVHSVGGQIAESQSPYRIVGEQVIENTLKSAPQHDTHWVERYWVERCTNKYWYYRYCWMEGRKIHRCYLGSVRSVLALGKKEMVESAIADGKLPLEIKKLIRNGKNDYSPTMPEVLELTSF